MVLRSKVENNDVITTDTIGLTMTRPGHAAEEEKNTLAGLILEA